MLSWEYPPVLVGGLGRHVHALSVALAAAGHEVTVVTRHSDGAPQRSTPTVSASCAPPRTRSPSPSPPAPCSPGPWPSTTPSPAPPCAPPRPAPTTSSTPTTGSSRTPPSRCAEHLDLPLVTTMHATEAGRHQGWLPEEMNRTIHGVEHWLSSSIHPGDRLLRVHARRGDRPVRRTGRPGRRGAQRGRRPGLAGPRRRRSRRPAHGSPGTARWSGTPGAWSTRRASSTWCTRCPGCASDTRGCAW